MSKYNRELIPEFKKIRRKIQVKSLERVPDVTIRKGSWLGLKLDMNTGYEWHGGILYKVQWL